MIMIHRQNYGYIQTAHILNTEKWTYTQNYKKTASIVQGKILFLNQKYWYFSYTFLQPLYNTVQFNTVWIYYGSKMDPKNVQIIFLKWP